MIEDDHITGMLEAADPGAVSPRERAELRAMARATTTRGGIRRFAPRGAAAIAMAGVLITAGGAAAAAALGVWQPWAQDPDVVVHYEMPDGATCEYRIVFDSTTPEATQAAITAAVADPEVLSSDAISAAISAYRADPGTQRDADTGEPMGYGTENYNPEWEYFNAVNAVLHAHLGEQGLNAGLATRGQAECE